MSNKEHTFTLEYLKSLIHYNPDTGAFTWVQGKPAAKNGFVRGTMGTPAGHVWCNGCGEKYIGVRVRGHGRIRGHRLAYFYMTGEWPPQQVDHVNHDGMDNRWCNLRLASPSQNGQNRGLRSDNKTGVIGVSMKYGRYCAQIKLNGKSYSLGLYNTLGEAAEARFKAERRMFGEFSPKLAKKLTEAFK